jgi:predicted phage-related endonuclease
MTAAERNVSLLDTLGLSPDAIACRVRSIGGSDANIIMSGDDAAILALWEQKTGRRESDDLSNVLPVQMGSFTEPLNVAWFQKQTGFEVVNCGLPCSHPSDTWRTATLDGMVQEAPHLVPDSVFEAKHVGNFWKDDALLAKYQPQLHHNMACAGLAKAVLSVFKGNADWCYFEVDYDPAYGEALHKAEWSFWMAVQADEPPVHIETVAPPAFDAMREVCFDGNNAWASLAADWLAHRPAAKKFEAAVKDLKTLVEADVKRAHGHGIEISRSKAGALSIKETK